ncbi:MAG: efflux RND transporter periplasmic adaptor subunit [Kofleriaceae bacterium]|nr:efflux RND transporter periplasmic adaptor subunit [Kofleriaceae bacterium]
MNFPRMKWYLPVVLAFFAFMAFRVERLLFAAPPTKPKAKDVQAASRTLVMPGIVDERDQAPPIAANMSGNGVVEPKAEQTDVGAGVAGRIAVVAAIEGATVNVGDLLVELDNQVEKAAVAAATADVDAAKANLARAVRGSRAEDVKAAMADAETARARSDLSKSVAERLSKVAAGGGATVDEVDRASRQASADQAAARAADARSAGVLAGSRREDIALARAQVMAAEARRDQASATVEKLIVRAPIAGTVLQVKVRAGEFYQPGSAALVVLADTSEFHVRMDVDERDVGKVAIGDVATVRANAYPGVNFSGKVIEIGRRMGRKNIRTDDPTERNDTKILEVVILLDKPNGLVIGQRVTCYVNGREPMAK